MAVSFSAQFNDVASLTLHSFIDLIHMQAILYTSFFSKILPTNTNWKKGKVTKAIVYNMQSIKPL